LFYDYLCMIRIFWSLLFIRFYIHIAIYRSKLIFNPLKEKFGTSKMIFQVTTKGSIPIVQETMAHVKMFLNNYFRKHFQKKLIRNENCIFTLGENKE